MNGKAGGGVIIIKRKKVSGGDAHHGGAWKVAYADFVTAMMAFFLLMWLLNATTEEQRKGLAEYFDPRVPIARISGGGAGMFGGHTLFSEEELAQNGAGAQMEYPTDDGQARGETGVMDEGARRDQLGAGLEALESVFRGLSGESDVADEQLEHVRLRTDDSGLIIELFDVEGSPLFASGSARLSPSMEALLRMVGEAAGLLTNRIAVAGHTDAGRFASADYGNWELSFDRANAARRVLADAGIAAERFARVTGKADTEPAVPEDPLDPRNRRVTITILRNAAE